MSKSRMLKQSPLQMKKRLIQTRKLSNLQESSHTYPQQIHKLQIKKQTSQKLVQKPITFTFYPPPSNDHLRLSAGNSVASRQKPSSARLKLKDYLHLNNLQRKSKEKRTNSSSRNLEKSQNSRLTIAKKESEAQKLQKQKAEIQKARNNEFILKKQIEAKINCQVQKLNQIKEYLFDDFQPKEKANDTFVYLFDIYNSMLQVEGINKKVGHLVINYESTQPKMQKRSQLKQAYFWENSKSEREKYNTNLQQILQNSNKK